MEDEKAENKATLMFFGFLFILMAIGVILEQSEIITNTYLIDIGFVTIRLVGIVTIIKRGTILKTQPYRKIMNLLIAVVIIGAMFKIMHWPLGGLIITGGYIAISITYIIRFINKLRKTLLDIAKVLWVVSICCSTTFRINHWFFSYELQNIEVILFLFLILVFLRHLMQTQKA